MAFPNSIDTYTAVAGTSLVSSTDHAGKHNSAGSAVVALETALGTTAATNALTAFTSSDKAQRTQGGTLQGTVIINNGTLGTANIIGGTVGTALVQSGTVNGAMVSNGTLGTVTTVGGTINTSTIIKTPYAQVYSGSAIPTTSGSVTTLTFDTESYDTDAIYGTANPTRLTAKTSGLYDFQFNGGFASNSTGFRTAYLMYNGSTYIAIQTFPAVNGDATLFSLSKKFIMSVNDYVEIQVLQNSGGTLSILSNVGYSPYFSMTRIAPYITFA